MSMQKTKAKDIMRNFGKVEEVNINENHVAYVLQCKIKKVIERSVLESLDVLTFILTIQEDEDSFIFLFNIAEKDDIGDNALDIVNRINDKITYGKFTIDKDGDVYWSKVFDINAISVEDFKNYLLSCIHGLEELFLTGEAHKNEQH